jgi:hypothetical protein
MLAVVPQTAHGQRVTYNGSASYSGGTYIFDRRSDTYALGTGVTVDFGSFRLTGSVPVLIYNGGLVTTITQGVPLPTGGTDTQAVRNREPGSTVGTGGKGQGGGGSGSGSGTGPGQPVEPPPPDTTVAFVESFAVNVADPVLSLSAEVHSGFGTLRSLTLTTTTKIPLADVSTGITSGGWDVGAGASVVVGAGPVLVLADVAYWWIEDMPDLPLADGLSYAVGASVPLRSGSLFLMGLVSGLTQTIETMDPPVSATLSVSRSVGTRGFASVGAGVGLTESAPDLYLSAGWSVRLGAASR